jgi:hypothetical protein
VIRRTPKKADRSFITSPKIPQTVYRMAELKKKSLLKVLRGRKTSKSEDERLRDL